MEKEKIKQSIETASKKLTDYNDIYQKNETAVRSQIINPILTSLGWDIEEPSEVMLEDRNEEGRADYSLIKNKEKLLFIEAKSLSEDIESYKNISQLAKYAVSKGVDFGLLSNGRKWLLLRSYEKNTDLADRKLWIIDIIDDDIEKSMLRLKSISKDNIHNLNSLIEKQDLLSETWQTLISSPESLVEPISKIVKQQILNDSANFSDEEIKEFVHMKLIELTNRGVGIASPNEYVDFESERIETSPDTRIFERRPTKLTIRNFSKDLRSFGDILVETANYLIDNRLLDRSKIPIYSGYKRYIINTKPLHNNGEPFRVPAKLNSGYYVETHNSALRHIELAKRLLKEAGLSEKELKLQ